HQALGSLQKLLGPQFEPQVQLYLEEAGKQTKINFSEFMLKPGIVINSEYQPGFPSPSGTEAHQFSEEGLRAGPKLESLGGENANHTVARVPLGSQPSNALPLFGSIRFTPEDNAHGLRLAEALHEFKLDPERSVLGRWKSDGRLEEHLLQTFQHMGANQFALLAAGKLWIILGSQLLHNQSPAKVTPLDETYKFFIYNTALGSGRPADLGDYLSLTNSLQDQDVYESIAIIAAMTNQLILDFEQAGVLEQNTELRKRLLQAWTAGFTANPVPLDTLPAEVISLKSMGYEAYPEAVPTMYHEGRPWYYPPVKKYRRVHTSPSADFEAWVKALNQSAEPVLKAWPIVTTGTGGGQDFTEQKRFDPFEVEEGKAVVSRYASYHMDQILAQRPQGYAQYVFDQRQTKTPKAPEKTPQLPLLGLLAQLRAAVKEHKPFKESLADLRAASSSMLSAADNDFLDYLTAVHDGLQQGAEAITDHGQTLGLDAAFLKLETLRRKALEGRSEVRSIVQRLQALSQKVAADWLGEGSLYWTYNTKVRFAPLNMRQLVQTWKRFSRLKREIRKAYPDHPLDYGFSEIFNQADEWDVFQSYLDTAERLWSQHRVSPRLMLLEGLPKIRTLTIRTTDLTRESGEAELPIFSDEGKLTDAGAVRAISFRDRLDALVQAFAELKDGLDRVELSGRTAWQPHQFKLEGVRVYSAGMMQLHEEGEWADPDSLAESEPLASGRWDTFLRWALVFSKVNHNAINVAVRPNGHIILDEIANPEEPGGGLFGAGTEFPGSRSEMRTALSLKGIEFVIHVPASEGWTMATLYNNAFQKRIQRFLKEPRLRKSILAELNLSERPARIDLNLVLPGLSGSGRFVGKLTAVALNAEGQAMAQKEFALKMAAPGDENGFIGEEIYREELEISERFKDHPLFQKHFARTYFYKTYPIPKTELKQIEQKAAEPGFSNIVTFELDQWRAGDPLEKLLEKAQTPEEASALYDRVIRVAVESWNQMEGLLFDTGADDVLLTPDDVLLTPEGEVHFIDASGWVYTREGLTHMLMIMTDALRALNDQRSWDLDPRSIFEKAAESLDTDTAARLHEELDHFFGARAEVRVAPTGTPARPSLAPTEAEVRNIRTLAGFIERLADEKSVAELVRQFQTTISQLPEDQTAALIQEIASV
nr:hypothetical protein [Candidatus Omnitrophota bacterium]